MGRKGSSVTIDSAIIRRELDEHNYSKASIAKKIGYSREAVTKSINKGIMDIGMLEKIAQLLNVMPEYLQGLISQKMPYADHTFNKHWDNATEYFRLWLKEYEHDITIRQCDLPSDFNGSVPVYSMADFLKEYNANEVIYDDAGNRLSDDGYDLIAGEVLEFLHQLIAKEYFEQ